MQNPVQIFPIESRSQLFTDTRDRSLKIAASWSVVAGQRCSGVNHQTSLYNLRREVAGLCIHRQREAWILRILYRFVLDDFRCMTAEAISGHVVEHDGEPLV